MKTITNITCACGENQSTVSTPNPGDIHTTQSKKGFWRRTRKAKSGMYFESSSGGSVFVSEDDLWKMVEPHDAALCEPQAKPIKH